MTDWMLDRVAHLFFYGLPLDPYRAGPWRWYERLHLWGIERCGARHWDDSRCWVDADEW